MSRRLVGTYLAALVFLSSVLYVGVRSVRQGPGNDASVFYFATTLLFRGQNPYDQALMRTEWEATRQEGNTRPAPSPFANPPSFVLLVAPIVLFSHAIALHVFSVLNFSCLLVSVYFLDLMIRRKASPATRLVLATWSVMLPPTMKLLAYGQSALLVCAPLIVALYLLRRKSEIWAGFWLALSLAKFTISLPFLAVLILRRRWKAAGTALAVFLGANLALAIPVGVGNIVGSYRDTIASLDGVGGMNDPFSELATETHNIVSAKNFFVLILGKDRAAVQVALLLFTLTFGLLFVYLVLQRRKTAVAALEDPLEIALTTMTAMALAYHRVYDLAALMLVIYALAEYRLDNPAADSTGWKAAMATLFCLSFFVVGTRWSLPFDFVLAKLHLPSSPHFGSVLVIALLAQIIVMIVLASRRSAVAAVATSP